MKLPSHARTEPRFVDRALRIAPPVAAKAMLQKVLWEGLGAAFYGCGSSRGAAQGEL